MSGLLPGVPQGDASRSGEAARFGVIVEAMGPEFADVSISQPAEQGETGQAHRRSGQQALLDVLQLEVTEFMCQYGLDLRWLELFQKGVEKDNALCFAETREIGIAMTGTA